MGAAARDRLPHTRTFVREANEKDDWAMVNAVGAVLSATMLSRCYCVLCSTERGVDNRRLLGEWAVTSWPACDQGAGGGCAHRTTPTTIPSRSRSQPRPGVWPSGVYGPNGEGVAPPTRFQQHSACRRPALLRSATPTELRATPPSPCLHVSRPRAGLPRPWKGTSQCPGRPPRALLAALEYCGWPATSVSVSQPTAMVPLSDGRCPQTGRWVRSVGAARRHRRPWARRPASVGVEAAVQHNVK